MKLGKFGGVKIALLGILGTAVVAYAGYKILFPRSGEAAAALIPSDASFVLTLDAQPSEGQLAAFTKLANAIKKEGLDGQVEDGVSSLLGKTGVAKSVRQYLNNNLAFAVWHSGNGGKEHMLALFSINNRDAVRNALQSGSPVTGATVPAYTFEQKDVIIGVVGDYLAVSNDVETLNRAEQTRNGASSIAGLQEFKDARAALPADANVMCFVAPSALAELGKMSGGAFPTSKWMSFSAALRDGGVQFDYRGPIDQKIFANVGDIKPLDPAELSHLPAGAYGVAAYSQLSKYYSIAQQSAKSAKEDWDKGLAEFEKETGLSVASDVVPAFEGDTVLAVYPDASGNMNSVDGVLVLTDANGGKPADLVAKVRAFIEKKSAEEAAKGHGKTVHFEEKSVMGATVWMLDSESVAEMRKSMAKDDKEGAFANKNIIVAVKDGDVFLCSSDAMLTNVLAPQQKLSDDPVFAEMSSRTGDSPQAYGMVAIGRIINAFRTKLSESMKNQNMSVDDLIEIFGGPNAGFVCSGKMNGETGTATFFMPLNFEKIVHIIGSASKKPPTMPINDMESSGGILR